MISQKNRFHGHGSLRFVFKRGDVERCRYFTIKAIKNPRRRDSRIAIVVSKKIAKRAVDRNRIRRRLYELLRAELPLMNSPHDIACIVTSADVRTIETALLSQSLKKSLDTLGVTCAAEK